jgi:hypothetical protein
MNCRECQDILQRRLDGATVAPDAALERHLAECPLCRERHAAARRLLEGLRTLPRPTPPPGLAARIAAAAVRDRQRRRIRVRRSLYVTAALAASILLMLLAAYYFDFPRPREHPDNNGPVARKNEVPPPVPEVEKKPKAAPKEEAPGRLAALTGRLADKTLDQAKVLWSVANPVEGVPMGELPNVPELEPPAKQAKQEVSEGLQAVTQSARRALDYFTRELPVLDLPQEPARP